MNKATIAVSRNLQGILQNIDNCIFEIAGERIGFSLIVFTEGRASYGSNCSREDFILATRELLDLWEKGLPDIPAHEVVS